MEVSVAAPTRVIGRELRVEPDGTRESRTWSARVYSATELIALVRAAGYSEVKAWGGFDHEPFTAASRLVIVATR